MTKEASALEDRISQLESTIAQLRRDKDGSSPRVGRRRMLILAAAAVGGGIAAPALLSTQTALANNNDAILIGNPNIDGGDGNGQSTLLFQSTDTLGNHTHFIVKHDDSVHPNHYNFSHGASIFGVGSPDGEGVLGFSDGPSGWGIYGVANGGTGVVGEAIGGLDIGAYGTGRLAQDSTGSHGSPVRIGAAYEQVRDDGGAVYFNVGSNFNQWAPALVGGDNVGLYEAVTTNQLTLTNSDGTNWQPMAGLTRTFTTPFRCHAMCMGNADLWTAQAGYNQDIGIFISGGTFGGGQGTLVAWKESGGFAGTFSPNAAFVQGIGRNLVENTTYTIALYWKANKNASGVTIYAGAGPIGGLFSPSRLIVNLIPR